MDYKQPKEDDLGIEEFLSKLSNGAFGLPMTFWAYGVLASFVWVVAIVSVVNAFEIVDGFKYFYILMVIYYGVVFSGIWDASNEYKGDKVWAVLAKFSVIITAIPLALNLLKHL